LIRRAPVPAAATYQGLAGTALAGIRVLASHRGQSQWRLLRIGQVSRWPSVMKSANATSLGVWNSSSQSTISLSISAVPRPAFLKLRRRRRLAMPANRFGPHPNGRFSKASGRRYQSDVAPDGGLGRPGR
jgi:hypothetical protein